MFLILFLFFIYSLAAPKLDDIDPYGDDPSIKHYLDLGCKRLAENQILKYESDSVLTKVAAAHYEACLHAVWPEHTRFSLSTTFEPYVDPYVSFKKGHILLHFNKPSTFWMASADGFFMHQLGFPPMVMHYHGDKPPMKLDTLRKLSWPQDEDILSFTNIEIDAFLLTLKGKEQSKLSNGVVMLDFKNAKISSFIELKKCIQSLFVFDKYDSVKLKRFHHFLKSDYPDVHLAKIDNIGSNDAIVPLYDPFIPIPPNTPIAIKYNPKSFTPAKRITISEYSTIISVLKHKKATYCLVLSFNMFTG